MKFNKLPVTNVEFPPLSRQSMVAAIQFFFTPSVVIKKDRLTWEDFKLLPVLAEKRVCVVSASLNSSVI